RRGQCPHGRPVGGAARTALEGTDSAHTEPGTLRQRLLRQPGLEPVAPEKRAESERVGVRCPGEIALCCDAAVTGCRGDHDGPPFAERLPTARRAWPGVCPVASPASKLALCSAS